MNVGELKPNPKNPRRITPERKRQLECALDAFGDLSGIVFNVRTQRLVGGHQRSSVLPKDAVIVIEHRYDPPNRVGTVANGYIVINGERFTYREVDWPEDRETAANVAANRIQGEWVDEQLGQNLADLDRDLRLLAGVLDDEMDRIAGCPPAHSGDPDAVPAPPAVAKTKRGELWLLGEHRVLCGDATDRADVERLMSGERADLWLTDPPYGVSYESAGRRGKENQHAPIENDARPMDEMRTFWEAAAALAREACKDTAPYYWFACQGGDQMMMMMSISDAGWKVRHELIWVKDQMVFGRCDYHYKHEPILYGWKQSGTHQWFGDRTKTSVLEFDRPKVSDLHPTMKPVALVEYLMRNSSEKGALVLDSFGGSGTTLIAAEQSGRRAALCEIEPTYCDVILQRWATLTGRDPVREDGVKWSELQ